MSGVLAVQRRHGTLPATAQSAMPSSAFCYAVSGWMTVDGTLHMLLKFSFVKLTLDRSLVVHFCFLKISSTRPDGSVRVRYLDARSRCCRRGSPCQIFSMFFFRRDTVVLTNHAPRVKNVYIFKVNEMLHGFVRPHDQIS